MLHERTHTNLDSVPRIAYAFYYIIFRHRRGFICSKKVDGNIHNNWLRFITLIFPLLCQ